jgi:hypothetical protein
MKASQILALDASMLLLYLAAENPAATGIAWHEWLSVGLAFALAVHFALNWKRTGRVLSKYFRKLWHVSRVNLAVDAALGIAVTLVMVSGLAISRVVIGAVGLEASSTAMWTKLHALSATFALVFLAIHLGLHWQWMETVLRRVFTARSPRPVTVPAVSPAKSRARR